MSLINDALKRAKQAQEQKTPPQFRGAPLDTTPVAPKKSALPLALIAVAVVLVMLIGLGIFLLTRNSATRQPSAIADSAPATPAPAATPAEVPVTVAVTAPEKPAEPPAAPPAPTIIAPPAPVEPPLQIAPAVRLQGVLFSPTRPAAIINGRSLFVGDRIGDVRVIAIGQQSATVVWNGQTNVLTLER